MLQLYRICIRLMHTFIECQFLRIRYPLMYMPCQKILITYSVHPNVFLLFCLQCPRAFFGFRVYASIAYGINQKQNIHCKGCFDHRKIPLLLFARRHYQTDGNKMDPIQELNMSLEAIYTSPEPCSQLIKLASRGKNCLRLLLKR